MPQSTIAADLNESLNVEADFLPEIALHFVLSIYDLANATQFIIGEILDPGIWIDAGLDQNPPAQTGTNAIDIA